MCVGGIVGSWSRRIWLQLEEAVEMIRELLNLTS